MAIIKWYFLMVNLYVNVFKKMILTRKKPYSLRSIMCTMLVDLKQNILTQFKSMYKKE